MKEKPPHLVLNLKRTEILDRLLTNIFPTKMWRKILTNTSNKIGKGPSLSWKLVLKSFQTVLSRTQERNLHNSWAF